MLVEGEGRRRFHLQQPIDLLESNGVVFGEGFVYNGPSVPSMLESEKRIHEEGGLT